MSGESGEGGPGAVEVTEALVRSLLLEQHPDLVSLPLRPAASGWDNAVLRLGDDLAVRVPRRVEGASLVEHELRWLPVLLDGVPAFVDGGLDASPHLRPGRPGAGYPWCWAVTRWHEGEMAMQGLPLDPIDTAERLGRFLAVLHRPAPVDAPPNPWRGGPLEGRDRMLGAHLDRVEALGRSLGDGVRRTDVEEAWADLLATPPAAGPPLWLHGDLHVGNLIVRDGALAAAIDFGDLTGGDRATDLAVAWALFGDDADARRRFRTVAGERWPIDDATWRRARAWAVALNVAYLQGEHSSRAMLLAAQRGLAAAIADD